MAENDFLPFAASSSANVLSQSDYAALTALASGFESGVAKSAAVNKVLRQSSIMAAALAAFISDNAGVDVIDDGTTATIEANLLAALKAKFALLNGSTSNRFSVATPVASTDAAQLAQIGNFQGSISVTAATTLTSAIFGNFVYTPTGNAGGYVITLPSPTGNAGKKFTYFNASNGDVTLTGSNFNASYGSATTSIIVPSSGSVEFECDGTSFNGVSGSGAVGGMVRPTATTGHVGSFVQITTSSAYSLPAGGTWLYSLQIFANTTPTSQGSTSGILAGGTSIFSPSSNNAQGFALRIA